MIFYMGFQSFYLVFQLIHCIFIKTEPQRYSLRSRRLEVVAQEKTGAQEGDTPWRAPVVSFAHYFQAPATQAMAL